MVIKRIAGALGAAGRAVGTVLSRTACIPGDFIQGEVHITGGLFTAEVQRVTVALIVDTGAGNGVEFHTSDLGGRFRLEPRERQVIPFLLTVPWEAPLSSSPGGPHRGLTTEVRAKVAVAGTAGGEDRVPIHVEALPSQKAVLTALDQLGFQSHGSAIEHGRLPGVHQQLPVRQAIWLAPPPRYLDRIAGAALTFVADPWNLTVVIQPRGRPEPASGVQLAPRQYRFTHDQVLDIAWSTEILTWLESVAAGIPRH